MTKRRLLPLVAVMLATVGLFSAAGPAAAAPARSGPTASSTTSGGELVNVVPTRLLDTRIGNGAPTGPVAAGATLSVQIGGRGAVPTVGVAAVVVNVTVTSPTAIEQLTVFPVGTAAPPDGDLYFVADQTVAHTSIVRLGTDGRLAIRNVSPGTVQIVADVSSYYTAGAATAGGAFVPLAPARVLDTRVGNGYGPGGFFDRIAPSVGGRGGIPVDAGAVVVNYTVVDPVAAGFLVDDPVGGTSLLNFRAGQTTSNLAIEPLTQGRLALLNVSGAPLTVVADVVGYFRAGLPTLPGLYGTSSHQRLLDTRHSTPIAPHSAISVTVAGVARIPSGVSAAVVNVTALDATSAGPLAVYASGQARPAASNLNFAPGLITPNLVMAQVGSDGRIDLYNGSSGTVDIVVDVSGWVGPSGGSLKWTVPASVDPLEGQLTSVSCPSTTFCMAVDRTGHAVSWNGARWSTPALVDPDGYYDLVECASAAFCIAFGGGTEVMYTGKRWGIPRWLGFAPEQNQLSCVSATYCVGVDDTGSSSTWDGHRWSTPTLITPGAFGLTSVSCPSTAFCAATDSQGVIWYLRNAHWTQGSTTVTGASQVSCATATFCVAAASRGASRFDGHSWTAPAPIANGQYPTQVSCLSASFCMAVTTIGQAVRWNGTTWSGATAIGPHPNPLLVSCASATFCVAINLTSAAGLGAIFTGTTWTTAAPIDPELGFTSSVSCAGTSRCVIVDGSGGETESTDPAGGAWSPASSIDRGHLGLTSVSCPTSLFCAAAGASGNVLTRAANGQWSSTQLEPNGELNSVSCVSATFCMVAGSNGAYRFDGTDWTATSPGDFDDAVSCVSATFCVAIGNGAQIWDGTSWASVALSFGDGFGSSLSCASSSYCLAVDSLGRTYFYDGTAWHAAAAFTARGLYPASVSCTSASFCLAGGDGGIETFDGTTWSPLTPVGFDDVVAVDCSSPTACIVIDGGGDVTFGS